MKIYRCCGDEELSAYQKGEYGWYSAVIPGYYTPIPEFAIPFDEFDTKFICNISNEQKKNG